MSQMTQHITCVSADGDDINEMKEIAGIGRDVRNIISFNDLKNTIGYDFWTDFGYKTQKEFKDDWAISYHESHYQGEFCVYIVHSGIEHVYINSHADTLSNEEAKIRRGLIDEINGDHEGFYIASKELSVLVGKAHIATKSRSGMGEKAFNALLKSHPEETIKLMKEIKNLFFDKQDLLERYRIIPQSIDGSNTESGFYLVDNIYGQMFSVGPDAAIEIAEKKYLSGIKAASIDNESPTMSM